jgi:hypothetical protein
MKVITKIKTTIGTEIQLSQSELGAIEYLASLEDQTPEEWLANNIHETLKVRIDQKLHENGSLEIRGDSIVKVIGACLA